MWAKPTGIRLPSTIYPPHVKFRPHPVRIIFFLPPPSLQISSVSRHGRKILTKHMFKLYSHSSRESIDFPANFSKKKCVSGQPDFRFIALVSRIERSNVNFGRKWEDGRMRNNHRNDLRLYLSSEAGDDVIDEATTLFETYSKLLRLLCQGVLNKRHSILGEEIT